MRNCDQKPGECNGWAEKRSRSDVVSLRCCAIFALLIGLSLCDRATACPQFGGGGFENHNQIQLPVGTAGSGGKTWNSVSLEALRTEAILRHPPAVDLRDADTFADAMDALQAMGLDVVLTPSASDDSLTTNEDWEMIGNSNETGVILERYLMSRNATFSVNKKGAIEIISQDEMYDEQYAQTIIYRVDHLVSNAKELRILAEQIQQSITPEVWEWSGGTATIQPRIQSGHRLLIVSIHYQDHAMLRQFFSDLSVAGSGPSVSRSRSIVVGVGAAPQTLSRLVEVPGASDSPLEKSPRSMVLGAPQMIQGGGVF